MNPVLEQICEAETDPCSPSGPDPLSVEEEASSAGLDIEEAKSALAALKPTLMSMTADDIRNLKVGTTTAVSIGLAYASAYAEDRPLFEQAFTTEGFDAASYSDLANRAKAFWQADIHMRQELNTEGPLRVLTEEAKPLRAKLLRAAIYLWGEDQDLYEVVRSISRGFGFANVADDLGSLAALFTEYWAQAEGSCDVTLEDIAKAEQLGAEILRLLSPSHIEEIGEAKRLRHSAAEYLRQGIEDVRAAAAYLFRNNEKRLERYPSLFVKRRRKTDKVKVGIEVTSDSVATAPTGAAGDLEPSSISPWPLTGEERAIPQQV